MFLETGADAIDPCEPPPDGNMTLKEIKEKVQGRMCVFGNLELKLIENGTREEIRLAVQQCMNEAKRGGGYIIMPTAAPITSPLPQKVEENMRYFIEFSNQYGGYE
jgi:uroporphyrinogen-III decarboxylase